MQGSGAWDRFWFAPTALARLAAFRILCGWIVLYDAFLYDPRGAVWAGEHTLEATWRPIYAFELLGLDRPPSFELASTLHFLQLVAVACATVGFRTRTAWIVATILGFWSSGIVYSLTKVRHDRVALFFASAALGFAPSGARWSVDAWLARKRRRPAPRAESPTSERALWPIRLTQVSIAIGYCAAGVAKLSSAGWTNGYTLQGILLAHDGPWAALAAADPRLCSWLSWVTLAVETCFPLALLSPRIACVLAPAALAFHLGTWATMDTGPYMTLWFFLIAFVPVERVFRPPPEVFARHPWRTRLAAALLILGLCAVAIVMLDKVPWSVFLPMLAATAAVVWMTRDRGSPVAAVEA